MNEPGHIRLNIYIINTLLNLLFYQMKVMMKKTGLKYKKKIGVWLYIIDQ